jgi:hypothetical protein
MGIIPTALSNLQVLTQLDLSYNHLKGEVPTRVLVEEFRDLLVEEWNFRDIIQKHLEQLLEQQRIYWQQ